MNYNLQKDTSDEIKGNNLIEKYIQRPKELEDISLLNFAKTINVSGTKYQHARKENIVNIYPFVNANDESKMDEFYKQQCALHIPFRQTLHSFFEQIKTDEDISWASIFESYNLETVNTDLVCNLPLEQIDEPDTELSNEMNTENRELNAFELLSSLHNETNNVNFEIYLANLGSKNSKSKKIVYLVNPS